MATKPQRDYTKRKKCGKKKHKHSKEHIDTHRTHANRHTIDMYTHIQKYVNACREMSKKPTYACECM